MYGILRGYPLSHFYRTYRTLPYTVPPQRKCLALFRAVRYVADTMIAQQILLLHIQRPHDPVRREAPAAVHLGKTLCKLCRRAAPRWIFFIHQPRNKPDQRVRRFLEPSRLHLDQRPAKVRGIKRDVQSKLLLIASYRLQNGVSNSCAYPCTESARRPPRPSSHWCRRWC